MARTGQYRLAIPIILENIRNNAESASRVYQARGMLAPKETAEVVARLEAIAAETNLLLDRINKEAAR